MKYIFTANAIANYTISNYTYIRDIYIYIYLSYIYIFINVYKIKYIVDVIVNKLSPVRSRIRKKWNFLSPLNLFYAFPFFV